MVDSDELFSRNMLYWGEDFQSLLSGLHIAVFGLGGVGGFTAEALARSGVGELTLVDFDDVSLSNINRQLIALHSTIGRDKTDAFAERLKDINPKIRLNVINDFYSDSFCFDKIDFVADAIDTMRSKISLLENCVKSDVPVISSMGAGNRIDPSKLYICDISEIENKNTPFVSNILYQLKKRGITEGIPVVASREKPFCREKISKTEQINLNNGEVIEFTKITPASTPFVASCAGIFMASYIVRQFLEKK